MLPVSILAPASLPGKCFLLYLPRPSFPCTISANCPLLQGAFLGFPPTPCRAFLRALPSAIRNRIALAGAHPVHLGFPAASEDGIRSVNKGMRGAQGRLKSRLRLGNHWPCPALCSHRRRGLLGVVVSAGYHSKPALIAQADLRGYLLSVLLFHSLISFRVALGRVTPPLQPPQGSSFQNNRLRKGLKLGSW